MSAMNPLNKTAIVLMAATSKEVRRVLGLSLHGWENAMVIFLIVAGFFALIAGAATWSVVRLQRIELTESKNEFDEYKLTVEGKVADAKKEGIEAGKTAGNALVRAAELEREASNARLETEKIKGVVAWRTLSPTMVIALDKILAAKPGSVNLRYTDGDPESLYFAIQFSHILSKANWKVGMGARKLPNSILFGIAIPDATGDDVQTLRSAFSSARISFSKDTGPEGIDILVATIEGAPLLMVGSRAPPQLP